MNGVRSPIEDQAEARHFVVDLLGHYRSYHHHKETMAYSGMALYAGIFGAGLLSPNWPVAGDKWARSISVLAVVISWLFFWSFLQFQLHRRRWAALRAAGSERLLARWVQKAPSRRDLRTDSSAVREPISASRRVLGWFWPLRGTVPAVDVEEAVYPTSLVQTWLEQERRGTGAIWHERVFAGAVWLLFVLLLMKTWLAAGASSHT